MRHVFVLASLVVAAAFSTATSAGGATLAQRALVLIASTPQLVSIQEGHGCYVGSWVSAELRRCIRVRDTSVEGFLSQYGLTEGRLAMVAEFCS